MHKSATIWLDHSHMGRRASGIERITAELFNARALAPFSSKAYPAGTGKLGVMAAQMIGLPWAGIRNRRDVFVFPGFPPSPYFSLIPERSVLYVHDLFLLSRRDQLNRAGKYYMAPLFRIAIQHFQNFLTNSEDTATKLRAYCDPRASIIPYRPVIRNVLGLAVGDRGDRPARPQPLKVVAIGTIEPRKNFIAAAELCENLSGLMGCPIELHIIGRSGWGDDVRILSTRPGVTLHGFLRDREAGEILSSSDLYLCTSHEEGLGLPLLEAQYGGLPIIAPDAAIFREVLGSSGIYIDPADPRQSCELVRQMLDKAQWRRLHSNASIANIERWNRLAEADRHHVLEFFDRLISDTRGVPTQRQVA